jgi:hypothetical protein
MGVVPFGTTVFGIVITQKPVVPLSPVNVKDTVVNTADWFVCIVTLEIWRPVKFPLFIRVTVVPLSVVTVIFVTNGVTEGEGVEVEVGVGVELGADVDVGVEGDVEVGSGVSNGVGVGEGDEVGALVTANGLLIPERLPSVAVIVASEPAVSTVTEVDPTPLTKAFITLGLIDPSE